MSEASILDAHVVSVEDAKRYILRFLEHNDRITDDEAELLVAWANRVRVMATTLQLFEEGEIIISFDPNGDMRFRHKDHVPAKKSK